MKILTQFTLFVLLCSTTAYAQNTYQKMGQKALMDGDFKAAVSNLEKALIGDTDNVNTLSMLGYSYYHANDYRNAISTYSKLISLRPLETSAYYYRGKARNILCSETNGISNAEQEKLLGASITDFSRAIELSSEDPKFYQNRAIAYRDYGLLKIQKVPKSYDKNKAIAAMKAATDDFRKVLEINPGRKDISTELENAKQYLINFNK